MPELPTAELYRLRAHRTPREIHSYVRVRNDIAERGIQHPVQLATDGLHAVLEDGHKRVEAAVELGIKTLEVHLNRRPFSSTRRMKYVIRPDSELAKLVAGQPKPPVKKAPAKKAAAKKASA